MAKQEDPYVNICNGKKLDEAEYCETNYVNAEFKQAATFQTVQPQPLDQDSRKCSIKCQGNCYKNYEVSCSDSRVEKE